jgi:hypothetical protein
MADNTFLKCSTRTFYFFQTDEMDRKLCLESDQFPTLCYVPVLCTLSHSFKKGGKILYEFNVKLESY